MIQKLYSYKTIIFYWLLFMTAVALSFPKYSTESKFIIAFAVMGLFFTNSIADKKRLLSSNRYAFLSVSFLFFLTLLGGLYTDHLQALPRELMGKLPLLIIPLVIFSTPLTSDVFEKTHKYFSFGVLVASFSALFKALFFKYKGLGDYLYYHDFELFTGKHSTYFALFLVLAFLYFYRQMLKNSANRLVYVLILLFLLLMLYIVSNRISLISLGIGLMVYTFPRLNIIAKIAFVLSIIIGFILMINTPYFKKRFNPDYLNSNKQSEINLRTVHIKSLLESIRENNILLGTGTGGSRENLYQKYKQYHYKDAYIFRYNAHNQFLETALNYGLLGLLLMIVSLAYQFKLLLQNKNFFLLAVYLSLLIFMLTESTLERQSGIVSFSLFVSLLLLSASNKMAKSL